MLVSRIEGQFIYVTGMGLRSYQKWHWLWPAWPISPCSSPQLLCQWSVYDTQMNRFSFLAHQHGPLPCMSFSLLLMVSVMQPTGCEPNAYLCAGHAVGRNMQDAFRQGLATGAWLHWKGQALSQADITWWLKSCSFHWLPRRRCKICLELMPSLYDSLRQCHAAQESVSSSGF